MINPNELRIGNLIYLELGLPVLDIHSVKAQDIADYANGKITLDALNPIPLTPEWLGRCGFVNQNRLLKESNTWWKDGMGEYISYHGNSFIVYEGNKRVLKYFHQLQNLYFALTGEELEVKL